MARRRTGPTLVRPQQRFEEGVECRLAPWRGAVRAEHEGRRVALVGQDPPHLLVLDELAREVVDRVLLVLAPGLRPAPDEPEAVALRARVRGAHAVALAEALELLGRRCADERALDAIDDEAQGCLLYTSDAADE